MNRRGFLAALGAFALDPERLLWQPGARLISIPAPRVTLPFLAVGDIVSFAPYDTRYIVTAEALSMNEIADARFKMLIGFFEDRMGYLPVEGLYMSRPGQWPQIHERRA